MAMSTDPKVWLPEFQSPSLSQANNFGELFFFTSVCSWVTWVLIEVVYIEHFDQFLTSMSLSQVFVTIYYEPPGPNFHLHSRSTPSSCFIYASEGL